MIDGHKAIRYNFHLRALAKVEESPAPITLVAAATVLAPQLRRSAAVRGEEMKRQSIRYHSDRIEQLISG